MQASCSSDRIHVLKRVPPTHLSRTSGLGPRTSDLGPRMEVQMICGYLTERLTTRAGRERLSRPDLSRDGTPIAHRNIWEALALEQAGAAMRSESEHVGLQISSQMCCPNPVSMYTRFEASTNHEMKKRATREKYATAGMPVGSVRMMYVT